MGTTPKVLAGALIAALATAATVVADQSQGPSITPVAAANPRAAGYAPASVLAGGLGQVVLAQGSTALENPSGIVTHYGYENDVASPDDPARPQMVPVDLSAPTEAQKTEPDKNTYLVLNGEHGADSSYDYGTHFLFQGHENGAGAQKQGYLTRINLDADATHRVTLMATRDDQGQPIATIDGSTWDPWARRLLLTTENPGSPTYAATAQYPSTVTDVSGALGRGGYEGIQNDSNGNVWIVEDIGGSGKQGTTAKQPNSFVYRYTPAHKGDLQHGRLQALQVLNGQGQPITWQSQSALMAPDQVALHSYGASLATRWVTVHDTAVDGTAPFVANPLARAAGATPFKRPENGVFRPGTKFGEFYFTETGDTNATSPENGDPQTGANGAGGWGSLFRLVQAGPSAASGRISPLFLGRQAVTGLDNITFLSADALTAVEDAGDTLHQQRNALDSGYVWDVTADYSGGRQPARWLAEGRDPAATLDAANGGFGKNDGDNEITGAVVSDGGPGGVLGAAKPVLSDAHWRWFYTQQHGENVTYEVTPQR
jgi:hypothetical protein